MITTILIICAVIVSCTIYLIKDKKNKKKISYLLLFLTIPTFVIYFFKGNIESFSFEENLKKEIKNLFEDPEKLANIQPESVIIYLEKKLKKNPEDLQGWMILTRTCILSGYYQKADLHYKAALKVFPHSENLLLEYSILQKNANQTNSAIKQLLTLKEKFPYNMKARELLIDIFTRKNDVFNAKKEMNELLKLKENDLQYIQKIKKKYNLQ